MREVYDRNPNRWIRITKNTALNVDYLIAVRRVSTGKAAVALGGDPQVRPLATDYEYDELVARLEGWDTGYDYSEEK